MMLASTVCFAAMHATIRYVSFELHPFEIAFFRNLFGLVALVPPLLRYGPSILRTNKIHLHAVRGLLSLITVLSMITGLSLTPLAEATSLNFTVPIFATIGAILILGEALTATRLIALVVGFAGAVLILRPGFVEIGFGPVAMLISAASWGGGVVANRVLMRTESSVTVVVHMTFFVMPVTFVLALFVWQWPTPMQLFWLLLLGTFGTLAHICLTQAFKTAEATAVVPIDFTRLIWASLLGYFLFAEVPDAFIWVGAAMIFGAVLFITYYEARADRSARASEGGEKA